MPSNLKSDDDAALVRLAQSGELPAFDELVRRYQTVVLRFLKRRLNASDAEDVSQNAFVRAYERLRLFRPGHSFKSWLLTIVYHEMINHFRAKGRKMQLSEEEPIDRNDPAEQASANDTRTVLWATVKAVLSSDQATALWLFYAEDLPTAEIARVMDRSWVSTKVMLHRARTMLAAHLAGHGFLDRRTVMQAGEP